MPSDHKHEHAKCLIHFNMNLFPFRHNFLRADATLIKMKPLLLLCVFLNVVQGNSDHPPGHLQPLGSHQNPEEPITELHEAPSPQYFFENFVKPGKPVLFKAAAKKMPSFSLWTDEYLRYRSS